MPSEYRTLKNYVSNYNRTMRRKALRGEIPEAKTLTLEKLRADISGAGDAESVLQWYKAETARGSGRSFEFVDPATGEKIRTTRGRAAQALLLWSESGGERQPAALLKVSEYFEKAKEEEIFKAQEIARERYELLKDDWHLEAWKGGKTKDSDTWTLILLPAFNAFESQPSPNYVALMKDERLDPRFLYQNFAPRSRAEALADAIYSHVG